MSTIIMDVDVLGEELKPASIVKLESLSGQVIVSSQSTLVVGSKTGKLIIASNNLNRIGELEIKNTDILSIQDLAFDNCGNIFVAGEDEIIYHYSKDFTLIRKLKAHLGFVCKLSYDESCHRLFSASEDCSIIEWNLNSYSSIKLYSHESEIIALDYNSELDSIASSCVDSKIAYFSVSKRKIVKTVQFDTKVWCLKILNKKKVLVVGTHAGSLSFLDLEELNQLINTQIHDSRIKSLHLCKSQNYLISASFDQTIKIFDLNKDKVKYSLIGNDDWVRSAITSEDGSKVFAVGDDGYLRMWECFLDEQIDDKKSGNLLFEILRKLWYILYIVI